MGKANLNIQQDNFNFAGKQCWDHENKINSRPRPECESIVIAGNPGVCSKPGFRRKNKTDQCYENRLEPVLSHDLLENYLIGSQKSSQSPIGQHSASNIPQNDLIGSRNLNRTVIGQLQNPLIDENKLLHSEEKQFLSAKDLLALQFDNLLIEKDTNKNFSDAEDINDLYQELPGHTDVNSSHPVVAKCKDDLSNELLGDKTVVNLGVGGEKLHLETAATFKGDTTINNNSCSQCNLSLPNKPVTDLDGECKCLLFSHARHLAEEGKFSTPVWKLNNENKNTPSGLQHTRYSNIQQYGYSKEVNEIQDKQTYGGSGYLKHDQSDLESFYTARSDFGSEFYGLSAASFVTCREYLSLDPRSRLTKAKDILLKGRNYIKTKFSDYQNRLKSYRSDSSGNRRCTNTCGFPCFFLGREASQFSFGIPECSHIKGDNDTDREAKVNNSNSDNGVTEEFINGDNSSMSVDPDLTVHVNHVTNLECSEDVSDDLQNGPDVKLSNSYLREEGESEDEGDAEEKLVSTDNIMTVKLKEEPAAGSSEGPRTAKMETGEEEGQDDLPAGMEAQSMVTDQSNNIAKSENEGEQKPTNKRLRWVSAMDKTQSSSLHSSTTSNSSVEQFLYDREMDPEKLLKNLGFGFSPETDVSCGRIPDRFLLTPSSAGGIDLYQFVLSNPGLHHLLWLWDKKSETQSGSGSSNQSSGRKSDALTRPSTTFSSVLHGMKFIQTAQSEAEANRPDQRDGSSAKDISKISSVLDLPNRVYLASQGFYGKEYISKDKLKQETDKEEEKSSPKPVSAAQRRKQFLQSSKSKNWSLTDEPEDDIMFSESSSSSNDHGLLLRSFSEGLSISSESSLEGGDSFNEEDRRKSISNLRRQYQETIRQSIDGEFPVFGGAPIKNSASSDGELEKDQIQSTSERRKKEVERLMASLEDDGDYFAQSRQSSIKEVELVKKRSQPSKDSTLTSPMTPKNYNFSFEKDDEQKFQFSTSTSQANVKPMQEISIIVEDDTDSKASKTSEIYPEIDPENDLAAVETEIIKGVKTDTLGLSPLALMQVRSDSSHTLVSQDSNFDTDTLGGDLTPRPGDISPGILENSYVFVNEKQISGEELSESTSSSGTLNTMIICDREQGERSRSSTQVSMTTTESDLRSDQLKPTLVYPPQESFELEEISSADNGIEDTLPQYTRYSGRRGRMEKSASTHSDSSGFADLESAGEVTQSYADIQQENYIFDGGRLGYASSHHDKKMTVPPLNLHDNRYTHDAVHLNPVSKRRHIDSGDKFHKQTVIRHDKNKNYHICTVRRKLSPSDTDVPSLTSISYTATNNNPENKSLVYTINVPYKVESSRSLTDLRQRSQGQRVLPKRKFLSTVNVDVGVQERDNGAEKKNVFTCKGPVNYQEIDLDPGPAHPLLSTSELSRTKDKHSSFHDLSDLKDFQEQSVRSEKSDSRRNSDWLLSNRNRSGLAENGFEVKHKLDREKKSKEMLASAKRQMADWLLSNQKVNGGLKYNLESPKQHGYPLSMSTPSLKTRQSSNRQQLLSNQRLFERHSFDSQELLNEESDHFSRQQRKLDRNSLDSEEILSGDQSWSQSKGSPLGSQELFHYKQRTQVSEGFQYDDSLLSADESYGGQKRSSLVDSSLLVPEDHLEYLKLARLVNGPSSFTVSGGQKLPIVNYRPNVPLKHWTDLKKAKHLEEETRLMQHAVQRYKMELSVMETMLFNSCQRAGSELTDEERADIEELQCLWKEVRKELGKLEEHLSFRLTSVLSGNDNFSPLNAMEIIQSMIDLLREQLYQQQLCISRDVCFDEDDLDLLSIQSPDSSVKSASTAMSESALTEFSQQISDIRDSIEKTQLRQQKDLNRSFSDLKDALMAEVHSEMTSNTKWLQLQLQSKDNEIQRLKMEMFLQNLRTGTTRKRQYFESDV